ncbi:MAG: pyridoxal phosphate-dependent aminotransferase [Clostridiales bacterium]|nr:pyridoxal phosphate-dependent aminotransferase [Clostridiales bacterium]
MVNNEMYALGSKRSVIRELFEYGKIRAKQLGADKVFDFSIGNPSVPAPNCVNETITALVQNMDSTLLHGYTSAQGDENVRRAIAENLNKRYSTSFAANNIYMTCGAAAGLAISIRALCCDGDEFVILAPYFPEYNVFIKAAGGTPVTVGFDESFQIDFDALRGAITKRTKAVIVNSPNNPSGVVYSKETIEKLAKLLSERAAEYAHPIYIIADEPYRELVYDDVEVSFIPSYHADTLVCYSFSKTLSLPGERIGYIAVNPQASDAENVYFAVMGAGRALGYICAPALFQRVVAECIEARPNTLAYKENRDLLFDGLKNIGFECVHPNGAFYLFVKALEQSAEAFSDKAKAFGLLLVPGEDFAASGWVRVAYCVSKDMILRAMPYFKQLYDSYTNQ